MATVDLGLIVGKITRKIALAIQERAALDDEARVDQEELEEAKRAWENAQVEIDRRSVEREARRKSLDEKIASAEAEQRTLLQYLTTEPEGAEPLAAVEKPAEKKSRQQKRVERAIEVATTAAAGKDPPRRSRGRPPKKKRHESGLPLGMKVDVPDDAEDNDDDDGMPPEIEGAF